MNEELDVNSFQKAGEDERIDLNALVVHIMQKGRSESAIKRTLWAHKAFYEFLTSTRKDRGYEIVSEADLEAFVYEAKSHQKNLLMGLGNVFDFLGREDMRQKTSELREEMLSGERKSMPLKEFLGIEQKLIQNLAGLEIKNASQLLEVCVDQTDRQALAEHCGFSYKALLELIKMADLTRIFGVKATRARLYLESGFDTLDKLAQQDPHKMREALVRFVEETGFQGIATLPKEAEHTIDEAKRLPKLIQFSPGE